MTEPATIARKPYCRNLACKLCAYLRLPILQAETPVPMDAYLPPEMV